MALICSWAISVVYVTMKDKNKGTVSQNTTGFIGC